MSAAIETKYRKKFVHYSVFGVGAVFHVREKKTYPNCDTMETEDARG